MPVLSHPLARFKTLCIALAGVGAFQVLHWPLPFLFGPMAALLLAALAGVNLKGVGPVSDAARTILGVAIGASITPALLGQLPTMSITVALVPVFVLLTGLMGVPYFRRVCGFDPVTSYYSAMPGGLQDMVLFGKEAGGQTRTISLIQATRLLAFVTIAPFVLSHYYGLSLFKPVGAAMSTMPRHELELMLLTAALGWWLGKKVGLFGAPILGPLILAAIASLSGQLHLRPPQEAVWFAQLFVGIGIGVHYSGVTIKELRSDILKGMGFVGLLALLSASFIATLTTLGLGDPVSIFLAYAPAGQAEMAVFAIVVGADLGYVVAHHLVRIVLIIVGSPLAAAWLRRHATKAAPP
jgi:membrane AbrB-like protein